MNETKRMNEQTYTECWFCEDCHAVEATTVAWEDRDLWSVVMAINTAHRRISPDCGRMYRDLRVVNWGRVTCRADLEADPTVPRWVIEPIMRLHEAMPETQE